MPRGAIIDGNLNEVLDVDLGKQDEIQEYVTHSWYKYGDEQAGLHPFQGETVPNFELGANTKGDRKRIENIDEAAKYSWIKAPRWKGHAMEVGPLARYIIGYAGGHEDIKNQVEGLLRALADLLRLGDAGEVRQRGAHEAAHVLAGLRRRGQAQPRQLVRGEAREVSDVGRVVARQAHGADLLRDADAPEVLHGARLRGIGLRVEGRGGLRVHHQAADAAQAQFVGEHEAAGAGARDEHVHGHRRAHALGVLQFLHCFSSGLIRRGRRRGLADAGLDRQNRPGGAARFCGAAVGTARGVGTIAAPFSRSPTSLP